VSFVLFVANFVLSLFVAQRHKSYTAIKLEEQRGPLRTDSHS